MWIALWALASCFIMGVFLWSAFILHQQKQAWSAFAKKHGLSYVPGKMMEAPAIKGAIFGYQVAFFPDLKATADQRGERYVTVLEFDIGQGMNTGAVIASKDFATLIANLSFSDTMKIEYPGWDDTRIVRTRDTKAFNTYMTKDRLDLLHNIMSMKNSSVLYFFDEENAILRIETSDPIKDTDRLEKIAQKVTSSLGKFRLTDAERAALTSPAKTD